jgi:3-phosphoshikimate 1-carboxyvinyltransferase
MTLALLNDLDIQTSFVGNKITVIPRQQSGTKVMTVESIELR